MGRRYNKGKKEIVSLFRRNTYVPVFTCSYLEIIAQDTVLYKLCVARSQITGLRNKLTANVGMPQWLHLDSSNTQRTSEKRQYLEKWTIAPEVQTPN